ncbi:MAG: TerB N-terminal domain-containing protein [Dehalococcoidales bacterium]|nr:TerB N-terminal domain-containing protein [Dehalococcoidales bacterium]
MKSSEITTISSLAKTGNQLVLKGFTFPNLDLLFISDKDPKNISVGLSISISISFYDGEIKFSNNESDDPSTIFLKLPIKKPTRPDSVEALGYYPSYAALRPEQRWVYLNWLQDVTEEVDIGYVFIYYYGLERQLLTGKFDRAYDEILKLRRFHRHKSFLGYSESSLVNSSLLVKRPDKLTELQSNNEISAFGNSLFLIAYYNNYNLSVENLMLIFDRMSGLNKRYFRENRHQFKKFLLETLTKRFAVDSFPFAKNYDVDEATCARYPLFANTSLPSNIRAPDLPNFYAHERLTNELKNVFTITSERFKNWKKEKRGNNTQTRT